MTEEGKKDEIKKLPKASGTIHSKSQLEKDFNLKNEEDVNNCIIV